MQLDESHTLSEVVAEALAFAKLDWQEHIAIDTSLIKTKEIAVPVLSRLRKLL
jgi:hypothetical protein